MMLMLLPSPFLLAVAMVAQTAATAAASAPASTARAATPASSMRILFQSAVVFVGFLFFGLSVVCWRGVVMLPHCLAESKRGIMAHYNVVLLMEKILSHFRFYDCA